MTFRMPKCFWINSSCPVQFRKLYFSIKKLPSFFFSMFKRIFWTFSWLYKPANLLSKPLVGAKCLYTTIICIMCDLSLVCHVFQTTVNMTCWPKPQLVMYRFLCCAAFAVFHVLPLIFLHTRLLSNKIIHLVCTQKCPQNEHSYPLIRTRTCTYQGVRYVRFSVNFSYILNEWSLVDDIENIYFLYFVTKEKDTLTKKVKRNISKVEWTLFWVVIFLFYLLFLKKAMRAGPYM